MKKVVVLLLLAVSFACAAAAADNPLGIQDYTSVDQLAADIESYFPKVQGEVTAVDGEALTISLGTQNGLVPGVALTLWRDGKEIRHPVTGAVIGRMEDEVGTAEVTGLAKTSCTAVLLKKLKDPKPGDKARITPKKINLAVVPVNDDRPDIVQGLAAGLDRLGRFSLLDGDKVAAFLKNRKDRDAALIREMNKTYNLDVVAAVGVYPSEDGKPLVVVKLFYADEARKLDTIVAKLDLASKKDVFGEVKPFFAPAREDRNQVPDLPFDARFIAVADFEGTGGLEYALSDGVRLHVYRHGAEGWSEEWSEPVPDADRDREQINLDEADINGNGRPELFVTVMKNGVASSYVLEYDNGRYGRIAEIPGFVRVVSYPGTGSMLIGQDYDPRTFYAGRPKQYAWSKGSYRASRDITLPRGLNLYDFTLASLGEADPLFVALDGKEHILVYSGDTLIWKSAETYPSVGVTVHKQATTSSAVISQSVADAERGEKVHIPGRILAFDANGDGTDEIILPKNSGGSFFGGYTKADIVSLGWTGARLEQRWSITDIPGAVVDFGLTAQKGGGAKILAIVKTSGGPFKSDRIRVMSYRAK